MTGAFDCPVCPRRSLPAATTVCPGCGADLSPKLRVRELGEVFRNDALAAVARGDLEAASEMLGAAASLQAQRADLRVLQGKVCWLRGRRSEAVSHWRRGAESDADNQECRELLAGAAERPFGLARLAGWLAVGAVATAAIVFQVRRAVPRAQGPRPAATTIVTQGAADASSARTDAALDSSARRLTEAVALMRGLRGVRLDPDGRGFVVRLPVLFEPGSIAIATEGRHALASLAACLRGYRGDVTIEGLTDSRPVRHGGRWRDNDSLAFARAVAGVEYLRASQGGAGPRLLAASGARRSAASSEEARSLVLYLAP